MSYRTACPGCGAPLRTLFDIESVPQFNLPEPPPERQVTRIESEMPCQGCGYSLRGFGSQENCPECGTPVWASMAGGFVRFVGPDYLARVRRGFGFIELGLAGRAAALCSVILFGVLQLLPLVYASAIVAVLAAAASGYGWWLVTSEHVVLRAYRSRLLARWSAVASTLLEVITLTAMVGVTPSAVQMASFVLPLPAWTFVLMLIGAWLVSAVIGVVYVWRLAGRIRAPSLARYANTMIWLVPLLMVGGLVFVVACALLILGSWIAAFVCYWVLIERSRGTFAALHRQLFGGRMMAGM